MEKSSKAILVCLLVLIATVIISLVALGVFFYLGITSPSANQKVAYNGLDHLYKGQCLSEGYTPGELVALPERLSWLKTYQEVHPVILSPLERMIMDAEADGMCIVVSSGYRSWEEQKEIWEKSNYSELVAPPNCSEHQTGLALDLVACPMRDGHRDDSVERLELRKEFVELPEYQWLVENATYYGFEQTFRSDNQEVTGYPEEAWHWKYVIR